MEAVTKRKTTEINFMKVENKKLNVSKVVHLKLLIHVL